MSQDNEKNPSVNWGKLGKNIVAGAAVVAGVMLVAPTLIPAVITGIASVGSSAVAAVASAGTAAPAAASTGVIAGVESWLSAGIGALITKAVGAVAIYKGASYLLSEKNEKGAEPVYRQEADESFAAREDMRKMQAVMVARMKADGHQPAMALANNQRGR